MILAVLLIGLLAIALNAYFLPQNAPPRRRIEEGATAQVLQPEEEEEGGGGGDTKTKIPISVNYHLTRQCNYSCSSSHPSLVPPAPPSPPVCFDWETHLTLILPEFCFHTAKTSHVEPLENAKRAMLLLKEAGMRKVNFAGGEPFLKPKFLGQLAQYCKATLRLESVSIVTNGSNVTESWLAEYGAYVDIMAVSCDSFDEATNVKIGRGQGKHLEKFTRLAGLCGEHGVMFKVNTVVNRHNWQEDMNAGIQALGPKRWKCFQVLVIEEENGGGADTLRDARDLQISDEEFRVFCDRHQHNACFVPEGNGVMKSSYLLLDEYLCFLNKGVKGKTKSILEVGVEEAMKDVYWDEEGFQERGGEYDWTKPSPGGCGQGKNPELEF